jgi:hypothetical protein
MHAGKKAGFFALALITLRMQISSCLVIILLIGALVFTAGCAQGTGPVMPATPLPVTQPDLHGLALNPSDVPVCFSLAEQQVKSSGDVGKLAKDLGWQAGYMVTYTCPAEGHEPTTLLHSLAVYPAANMPGIVSMVDEQDRQAGYTYEDLSFPNPGSALHGFYGKAGGAQVSGTSPGTSVLTGRDEVPRTSAVSGSDVAEIITYRGTIFEVLKMTGPETNTTVLRDMAQKAYAKIP